MAIINQITENNYPAAVSVALHPCREVVCPCAWPDVRLVS